MEISELRAPAHHRALQADRRRRAAGWCRTGRARLVGRSALLLCVLRIGRAAAMPLSTAGTTVVANGPCDTTLKSFQMYDEAYLWTMNFF
jgi:hypothetical protein